MSITYELVASARDMNLAVMTANCRTTARQKWKLKRTSERTGIALDHQMLDSKLINSRARTSFSASNLVYLLLVRH